MHKKQKDQNNSDTLEKILLPNLEQDNSSITMTPQRWIEENSKAIESMNDFVEKNGLPLAKHRLF